MDGASVPGPEDLALDGWFSRAEEAVDAVAHADLTTLSEREVEAFLERVRRPIAQLEGVRSRLMVAARRRRAQRSTGTPTGGMLDEHRRQLGQQQRLAPGEVDRLVEAGRAAELGSAIDRALRDGELGPSQARTIGRILATLLGEQRDEVEAELLELAQRLDPIAFGRAARRVQARVQPEVLAGIQRRQEFQRRFRGTDTDDGGYAFSGLLYGTAAETARVALQAFRRPDAPDEHRSPEQRGADAFEQLCATALAAGEAPTRHGARPQVMVVLEADALAALGTEPASVAGRFVASGQPISGRSLRQLVDDCQLVRLVVDADRVPIEVSTTVRTVPAGLWRALLARDGGCVWPGFDAPASWCDVAHGASAFADGGRLSVDNSLLLCRRHHRRFDAGPREVRIVGDQVRFPNLERQAAAAAGRSGDAIALPRNPLPTAPAVRPPDRGGPPTALRAAPDNGRRADDGEPASTPRLSPSPLARERGGGYRCDGVPVSAGALRGSGPDPPEELAVAG